ncbi:hypothetical protein [Natrinema sp. HArc-T2]|uniref:hypothetical protein n=1 Tax=Natrinema sp. HArc-T2 TaxID=3242701 RepID=UPI00359CD721
MNPGEESYGFAQFPSQTLEKQAIPAPLPNLSFASAWASPGGGFPGVLAGGSSTALGVLG